MRRGAILITGLLFALTLSTPAASAPHYRPVYRIDRVFAVVQKKTLIVDVSGAVRSGGWTHPRLRIRKPSASENDVMEIDFVADPPSTKHVVVQELLPVKAELKVKLPKFKIVAVGVAAETNQVTTQIR